MKKFFEKYLIYFITALALLLRLINIDKASGLWPDEMFDMMNTNKSYVDIITSFFSNGDIHPPTYQILSKFWQSIGGTSDVWVRIFSVIWGVLTIPIIYLAGKEISSTKVGLVAAFLMAISSFNIYYSQEARAYSLVIFFTCLFLLFWLRLLNNKKNLCEKKSDIVFLIIASLGLLYTHTLSLVFVFLGFLILFINLLKEKEKLKPLLLASFILLVLYFPAGFVLVKSTLSATGSASTVQWWFPFSFMRVVTVLNDFFSPYLIGLPFEFKTIGYFLTPFSLIIHLVPLLIGFFVILKSATKKTQNLLTLSLLYLLFFIGFSMVGKISLIPRYLCQLSPCFLLLLSCGFFEIKRDSLKKLAIFLFIFINLIFLAFSTKSAFRQDRPLGIKKVSNKLIEYDFQDGDGILIVNYSFIPYNYYLDKPLRLKTGLINFTGFLGEMDSHERLAPLLFSNITSNYLQSLLAKLSNSLKYRQKFLVVINNEFNLLSPIELASLKKEVLEGKKENYHKIPLGYLISSSLNYELDNQLKSQSSFKFIEQSQTGSWDFYLVEKQAF